MTEKEIFVNYLKHNLENFFFTLPVINWDEIYPLFLKIKADLLTDIFAKYPQPSKYPEFNSLQKNSRLLIAISLDAGVEALFLYRLSRVIYLEFGDKTQLLPYLANLMRCKTGIEIYYSTDITPGINLQHGSGIIIGPRYRIGKDFIIHQGVTLGQQHLYSPSEIITVGDNVVIYAGAKILGNISIGNNVQVGANAVVTKNLASNAIYAGVPAKKIKDLS